MSASTPTVSRLYFAELDFEGAPIRVNSSPFVISWNGNDWKGLGGLASISNLIADTQMSATQLTLTLNDVALQHINDLDTHAYQGRTVNIWQCEMTNNGFVVADSTLVWAGFMDELSCEVGSVGAIAVRCESFFANWNRIEPEYLNDQTQQLLYAGDRGMEYMAVVANVSIEL